MAGELVSRLLAESKSKVIPVDSEHSAIYQCLVGEEKGSVNKLIITASGGPFRTMDSKHIARMTAREALLHPRWQMGAKITIDSATMLNKAFEIIEARWLFDIEPERIEAVVHPQSIIHSMVEFIDGAVKAQLGIPDMRLPIRYALGDASRLPSSERPLSLADYSTLTFEKPDAEKFPCLTLAPMPSAAAETRPASSTPPTKWQCAPSLTDAFPSQPSTAASPRRLRPSTSLHIRRSMTMWPHITPPSNLPKKI